MTIFLSILSIILLGLCIATFLKARQLDSQLKRKDAEISSTQKHADEVRQYYESEMNRIQEETQGMLNLEGERNRKHYESEAARIQADAQARIVATQDATKKAIGEVQSTMDRRFAELATETKRIRAHYEAESRKVRESAAALIRKTLSELEPLRKYEGARDAEAQAQQQLSEALSQATSLRAEADNLLEQARTIVKEERAEIIQKANAAKRKADSFLDQALQDAGRIVKEAEKQAKQIGGDAYVALRDKEILEQAVQAIWNVVEGYGDRYIIPTRGVLDDLAADFGHVEAGMALKSARDQTRRMIEQGLAADCNYEEEDRRARANRFVTDAFNGRVDAILSRTKHDNYGTLEQEIRDAFKLVNLNGLVFRDARILPAYLDARLAELKWAVVVQELKLKAREEQRRIQEQMREEEKVQREQERAIKDAQDKEEAIKQALEKARLEAEHASSQERAKFDAQIAELNQRLTEAEAVKKREISMAQLTRAGNIYIISNIGSFGEDIFKIGMTRRRDPMERIWELGDASVPFDFDVHAMIFCEDAPALENMLHDEFFDLRINKINDRKEFFRIPLERVRSFVTARGLTASFTMEAEAHEYRQTRALEKMTPEEREKYHLRRMDDDELGSD